MVKNILSVDDLKTYSTVELLYKLANQTSENTAIIEYLMNNGLSEEIMLSIQSMLKNGELTLTNDMGYYNVTHYGIDNTGKEDVSIKLQELIDKLSCYMWRGDNHTTYSQIKQIHLYFPKGKYLIENPIFLPPYITIEGDKGNIGNNYNLIDFKELNGTVFIGNISREKRQFVFNVESFHDDGLRQGSIDYNYNAPSSQLYNRCECVTLKNFSVISNCCFGGVYAVGSPFLSMENVMLLGQDISMYLRGSWNVRVKNVGFNGKNYGLVCHKDVNNCTFEGCSFEHYGLYSGNGNPDVFYDDLPFQYQADGSYMPQTYHNISTAIYLNQAWQVQIINSTIQNYQRGICGLWSNAQLSGLWFESIKAIDLHTIHANINVSGCRKETTKSYFAYITGSSYVVVENLSGNNAKGNYVGDETKLVEYIMESSRFVMLGTPYEKKNPGNSLNVNGIEFNGGANLKHLEQITCNPSTTDSIHLNYPEGMTRYNTVILGVNKIQSNGVSIPLQPQNYIMLGQNAIVFTPDTTGLKHNIYLMRVGD